MILPVGTVVWHSYWKQRGTIRAYALYHDPTRIAYDIQWDDGARSTLRPNSVRPYRAGAGEAVVTEVGYVSG